MICEKCGKEFSEDYRTDKRQRTKPMRFCSRNCANTKVHSEDVKQKISETLRTSLEPKKKAIIKTRTKKKLEVKSQKCPICGASFKTKKGVYCSRACASKRNQKKLTDWQRVDRAQYGYLCKFTFGISLFPEEFDSDLIKKYGWYAASNRGNNLSGVSRDHLYSVNDGYYNHVDPLIMKHPANCRLLPHRENQHKNRKSAITLEDLLNRIHVWDKKYFREGDEVQLLLGSSIRREYE